MSDGQGPEVGDEVEYDVGRPAIVTDIRKGIPYLRCAGRQEWPAEDLESLRVVRTREQRSADGDLW